MASPKDTHEDPKRGRTGHQPHLSWLPMPKAPANDNERAALWVLGAFFQRHVNWLVPTLLLAAFSLALLILRS